MSSGASTASTQPVSTALRGMPSKRELSSVCAMTRPPVSRTSMMPVLPSEPVPESTTATPRSPQAEASERKKVLIGWFSVFSAARS